MTDIRDSTRIVENGRVEFLPLKLGPEPERIQESFHIATAKKGE